jgi:hypothetical protein
VNSNKVSEHVDWEKLRDQYLFAMCSEESGDHRTLKKQRAPRRPRNTRVEGRIGAWMPLENTVAKEATKAIDEVRGVGIQHRKRRRMSSMKRRKLIIVQSQTGSAKHRVLVQYLTNRTQKVQPLRMRSTQSLTLTRPWMQIATSSQSIRL